MSDLAEAYPLHWPPGWGRTADEDREQARFGTRKGKAWGMTRLTIAQALARLRVEVERMGGERLIVSTNVEVRLDGLPYSNRRAPDDPGVAVYFHRAGEPLCMPCDRFDQVADNIAAIAATLGALRGLERWGTGQMTNAAFTGFKALPVRASGAPWYEELSVEATATVDQVNRAFKRLAARWHPDRPDGDAERFQRLNDARRQGLDAATAKGSG